MQTPDEAYNLRDAFLIGAYTLSESRPQTDLGFEADLFKAADRLRGSLEP